MNKLSLNMILNMNLSKIRGTIFLFRKSLKKQNPSLNKRQWLWYNKNEKSTEEHIFTKRQTPGE